MNNRKYIGMDVHQASISIAVSDAAGKVLMECIIETKAATVLEFIQGLRGSLWVTFEEGTSAAWLYDLLKQRSCRIRKRNPKTFRGSIETAFEIDNGIVRPQTRLQLLTSHDLAGFFQEGAQKLERFVLQPASDSMLTKLMGIRVQRERTESDGSGEDTPTATVFHFTLET